MKTLHKYKRTDGYKYMETLCGLLLDSDVRRSNDVLLATLNLDQTDIDFNFGKDAMICQYCKDVVVPEEEELVVPEEVCCA